MAAKITLTVVHGTAPIQQYVFSERTTCIIGRDEECMPRIPNDADHRKVSRTHCLLDINPPDIRIRDFGSRNGTFVNGTKIGQRSKSETRDQGVQREFPEHDLKDGDEIRLDKTVFKVGVQVFVACERCGSEIPEPHLS